MVNLPLQNIWSVFKHFKGRGLALTLGGGNIRALAHVGILKVLERNNIRVTQIASNSAGAIVGALYAAGMNAEEIESVVMHLDWFHLVVPSRSGLGFISGRKLERFMDKYLPVHFFKDTKIPLSITSTDLITGKEYVFKHRNERISVAVRASSCVPGLFSPVAYKNKLLVDGLLVNNMPVNLIDPKKSSYHVAVNVLPFVEMHRKPKSLFEVISRSYDIKEGHSFSKYDGHYDLLLQPHKKFISVTSGGKKMYKKLIDMGELEAERFIDKIKRHV